MLLVIPAFSQEIIFQKKEIFFTISHALKTVKGECSTIHTEALSVQQSIDEYSVKFPFTVSVDVKSMTTKNSNRDSHLLETLGYPEYKTIDFKAHSISKVDPENYNLQGKLTIQNASKDITIPVKVTQKDKLSVFSGNFIVRLTDFSIKPPSLLFMSISDDVKITFNFY